MSDELDGMLNWKAPEGSHDKVGKIVRRAVLLGFMGDRLSLHMDILATHCNGCPLDLDAFLEGQAEDFMHDIYGISRHIDRKTGKLGGLFLPRSAK